MVYDKSEGSAGRAAKAPKKSPWRDFFEGAMGKGPDKSTSGNTKLIKKGPKTSSYYLPKSSKSTKSSSSNSGSRSYSSGSSSYSGGSRSGGIAPGGGRGRGSRGLTMSGGKPNYSKKGLRRQANRIISRDIQSVIRDLRHEGGTRRRAYNYEQNQTRARYQRTVGDLNHIFGETEEQNKIQTQKILDNIAKNKGESGALYDSLVNTQQTSTDQAKHALMAELSRLGITQSADLGTLEADAQNAMQMARQQKAYNIANLMAMSQNTSDIGALISQTAQGSRASSIGKATNTRNDQLADATQVWRGDRDEILNAMRSERKSKANRVEELYREMESQAYERWFNNREANRQHALGVSNFNLSASQFNADNMWRQAALLQEQRQQAALARAQQAQMRAFGNQVPPNILGALGMNS